MNKIKSKNPCDICILSEPCDDEVVEGIQYHLASTSRTNGKPVSLYPPYENAKKKFVGRDDALENSHAILVILSDNATARFKEEDANTLPFFQLVKRALDLEKANKVRILPIFLSQMVRKDGLEGFAKFSNWSYKCKNEEVRTVMDRIGSLQGVFLDADEEGYEMKALKFKRFWQEAHQSLVPLTSSNIKRELDWDLISAVLLGILIGIPILIIPLFLTFSKSIQRRWLYFRKGLLLGNALILFIAGVFVIIYGTLINDNSTDWICSDPASDNCQKEIIQVRNDFFTAGAVVMFAAAAEFVLAHLWASSRVRTVADRQSKARVKARMDSRASKSIAVQPELELHEVVV